MDPVVIGERDYAAVHLGDGSVSVLVSTGSGTREGEFRAVLSMHAGTLQYLDLPDNVHREGVHREGVYGESATSAAGHAIVVSDHIDDGEMLVGSTVVNVEHALGGTIASALTELGVSAPLDLVEIACPSAWGAGRTQIVRRAVGALARDVAVVDSATSALHSAGERAPDFGVVVDVGELGSTVSALVRTPAEDTDRSAPEYTRRGRWEAVGWHDESLRQSTANRIAECVASSDVRGVIDVFVVDSTVGQLSSTDPVDPNDPRFRIHRLSGLDVVRALAARVGFSATDGARADTDRSVDGRSGVPDRGVSVDGSSYFPPDRSAPAGRAAPWLTDVHIEPESRRSTPLILAGVAGAVVLAVGAALFGVHVFEGTSRSVAAAEPTLGSSATEPVTTTARTSEVTTSAAPTPTAAPPSTAAPPPTTPTPDRVPYGRIDFELPSAWTARPESERVILVPPDLPERRIVLAATELAADVTFDAVADELTAQLDSRGDGSTIGNLTRATDFGGRTGLTYDETPGDGSIVRWRVFVDDGLQISVGCQTADDADPTLDDDCAHVASSIEVAASR